MYACWSVCRSWLKMYFSPQNTEKSQGYFLLYGRKQLNNKYMYLWSSARLASLSGRRESGPLFVFPSHFFFSLSLFLFYFCKLGLLLTTIKFLKTEESKEVLLAALRWGGTEARDPKAMWAVGEESRSVYFYTLMSWDSRPRVVSLSSIKGQWASWRQKLSLPPSGSISYCMFSQTPSVWPGKLRWRWTASPIP